MINISPPDACQFDESVCAYLDDDGLELNNVMVGYPPLTDEQIADAVFWSKFRDGNTANLMLITGEGGSGKGVLMNMLGWKFKRYYPGCKAILDYMPRRPFGSYHLFNQDFVVNQVDRMAAMANGECANKEAFQAKTREWITSQGEVFFKNCVGLFDEYRRHHNNRRPHNPMGILLIDVYNIIRHIDALLIGATVKQNELDRKALHHVKYHVKMRKDDKNPQVFIATINWVRWSDLEETFIPYAKYAFPIYAAKPRPELGIKPDDWNIRRQTFDPKSDYYTWFDLFNSKNAVALGIPKSMRPKEQ